mmetsp:Transcript_25202/g.57384  ORF Transcript_25202/g.57384 Transcript_25202/m.57384 type:complete len:201 (+) Transcript_25202:264-866(+)
MTSTPSRPTLSARTRLSHRTTRGRSQWGCGSRSRITKTSSTRTTRAVPNATITIAAPSTFQSYGRKWTSRTRQPSSTTARAARPKMDASRRCTSIGRTVRARCPRRVREASAHGVATGRQLLTARAGASRPCRCLRSRCPRDCGSWTTRRRSKVPLRTRKIRRPPMTLCSTQTCTAGPASGRTWTAAMCPLTPLPRRMVR